MNRFYVNTNDIFEDEIIIKNDDVKHIKNVLRLDIDDEIIVCDGKNNDYKVVIKSIDKNSVLCKIIEKFDNKSESNLKITLYQGLPKSSKMDLIIQKATELGVSEIVPIITDRTIVKIKDSDKENKKIDRWSKIALEASKQCRRGIVPEIKEIMSFEAMISKLKNQKNIIVPYENEENITMKKVLSEISDKNISIIIGPEGGFEDSEIKKLVEINSKIVTLGPRILRTETAGFTAIAITMYELGDLG